MSFTTSVYGIVSGELVSSGVQNVYSGGTIVSSLIINGGWQYIFNGGVASYTQLDISGRQIVSSGGTAYYTLINTSGEQLVYGSARGAIINNGGYQNVDGYAESVTINSGGGQFINSTGTANSTLINSGGSQIVNWGGGIASNTIISGGNQTVWSGSVAVSTLITANGSQYLSSGASATDTVISSGVQTVSGGNATATLINNSGSQALWGGAATSTIINSGGRQSIFSGAAANYTSVNSGGNQMVDAGGNTSGAVISSGGVQTVNGGTANSTSIDGGMQFIGSGGTASNTLILSGGGQNVSSGGTAVNTIISSGGGMHISSGGGFNGAMIINGGGHVTIDQYGDFNPSAVNIKLANAQANDAIMIIQANVDNVKDTLLAVDASNASSGIYILSYGTSLTGLSGAVFVIKDGDQTATLSVGSSYTFADGDKLALGFTDGAADKLTASFTVKGDVLDLTPPTTPAGLKATLVGNNFELDWSDSTDAGGIRQYEIWGDEYADFSSPLENSYHKIVPESKDVIADIKPGVYYAKVRAQDNAGNWSGWSTSVSTTVFGTLALNSTAKGYVGSTDFYKLALDKAGILNLSLTGLTANADLALLTATGTVLKTSANTGSSDESINGVMLTAGNYFVKVGPAGKISTDYILGNTFNVLPVDSAANDYMTAKDINAGVDNWVGFGDAADFYKLTMTNAGLLSVGITGLTGDADLSLLNSAGTLLKSNIKAGTASEGISDFALLAGTYYVKVAAASGVNDAGYTLIHLEKYFPADTAANDYTSAKDIDGGVDNWVGFGDAADVYKLTMTNAGLLSVGITGLTGNADLSLLSSTGTVLKSNIKTGTESEGISDFALLAGTYYVKVAAASGVNDAGYILTHLEKYTPVDTGANTWQTAKDINAGVDNWVGFGDTADFYKLILAGDGAVTLGITGLTGDADLSLLNSSGTVLKSNIKTGTASEGISDFALLAGTYYVKVAAAAGVNDASYILSSYISDSTPPGVPGGLTMTYTGSTVEFDWNDSTDSSGIKQYEIMADEYADFSSPDGYHNLVVESKDSAAISEQAGSFYAKVRAQDNSGRWSAWSSTASLTVTGTLAVNSSVKDSMGSADIYKLTLDNAGILNLNLTGLSANADLSLLNAAGTVLKTSANTGTSPEAISSITLLAGTYYVKVIPSGKISTDYTLSNTFKAFPADTAANDYISAKNIDDGVDNWVGFGDAADFYKLIMTNAGTVTLGLTGLTGNADLSLLSSTGTVLKSNIKAGTESEGISGIALLAGTYYVKVAAATGVNDATYTLTHLEKCCPTDTGANTWQTAGDIATPDNWVGFGDAADFYKLTMTNAGLLSVGITGLTGNADLSLLSSTGTVLKTSSSIGTADEAINNVALLAGTYYVKVAAASGVNDAAYTLTHLEKYTPVDTGANTWQIAGDIATPDNWVGFGDAADFYKLTMTNAGLLSVGITGLTGNADLSLLSATGTVLKSNFKTGTDSEGISNIALLAGTYYVKVAAASGVNDAGYTLTHLEKYTPADTGANTWQTAGDIGVLDNWVGFGDTADFYKLTMTNAGILTLGLSGLTGNADLALLSSTGTPLKTSANTGLNNEAINSVALLAGTYYVKVAAATGVNDAGYTLTHLEKYTPADTGANTWQAAKDINDGVDNWVGFGDAADFYKLTMTGNGALSLGITGLTGNADLSLLSSAGIVLKSNIKAGTDSEGMSDVALLAGTYYIKVAAAAGVNDASYNLISQINYFPGDTYDKAGNTSATAKLVDGPAQTGWVGFGDSDDYYKFVFDTPAQGTIRLYDLKGGNADLSVYNDKGILVKKSSNLGILEDTLTSILAAGTYYARVNAVSGSSIDYKLDFSKKDVVSGLLAS